MYSVKILAKSFVTHDVERWVVERPQNFTFIPGQAVELAIDNPKWRNEKRPFSPTGHVDDQILEFMTKIYTRRDGVTDALSDLEPNMGLRMSDPFGTISYRGPGMFIAAGTGITPFLGILRQRDRVDNLRGISLVLSNKTPADIIQEKELTYYLGPRAVFTCTQQSRPGYRDRRIDRELLSELIPHTDQHFYVCGPPEFVEDVSTCLRDLGIERDKLVVEGS